MEYPYNHPRPGFLGGCIPEVQVDATEAYDGIEIEF